MLKQIWRDNPWIPVALGLAGVAATFALGGWAPGLVGVFILLVILLGAAANSVQRLQSDLEAVRTNGQHDDADAAGEDFPSAERPSRSDGGALAPPVDRDTEDVGLAGASEGEEADSLFSAMTTAAFAGDLTTVAAKADAFVGQAADEADRLDRRGQVFLLRSAAGDPAAIQGLRQLLTEHPGNPTLVHQLALAYEWAQDFDSSADLLEGTAAEVEDMAVRAANLLRAAEARHSSGRLGDARRLASEAATLSTSERGKTSALHELARILVSENLNVQAIAVLEEAAKLSPNDTAVRFDLAYHYSEQGLLVLAIHHYRVLLSSKPDSSMALNNLGVEFARLNMPFRAMANYRAAAAKKETLANSNIAYLFAQVGALELAKEQLELARSEPSPHQNVFEAEAFIARTVAEENEREQSLTQGAAQVSEVYRRIPREIPSVPTGEWLLEGFGPVTFVGDEQTVKGEIGSGADRLRVQIEVSMGALKVTLRTGQYSTTSQSGWGTQNGNELIFGVADTSNHTPRVVRFVRSSGDA